MGTTDDAEAIVERATQLVESQHGEAKRLLLEGLGDLGALPDGVVKFQALRVLTRCHREDGELQQARDRGREALELAGRLGEPAAVAVMLETLAIVEHMDGKLRMASEYFSASAEIERAQGAFDAMAAALSNHAHMLIVNDLEGAEPLLRRALNHAPAGTFYAAAAADNMGLELERQGRHGEAAEWARRSVDAFRALQQPHHVFVALRNLARHLADAGRLTESGPVFEEAHDLIHSLRRAEVDEAHYGRYEERVAAIEAHTREVLERQGEGAWMMIGVAAMLGEDLLNQGMLQLEQGHLGDAVESLRKSRDHWLRLEAWHCIVRVDYYLAYAYVEIGETREALELTQAVRALARQLGDAWREQMALSLLIRLRGATADRDPLDDLAQARALDTVIGRQLGVDPAHVPLLDGGVLDALAAGICAESPAYEVAERYLVASVAAAREFPEELRYRLVYRLSNLYDLLRRMEQPDRAAQVLSELREVASNLQGDPRAEQVLSRALARQAFVEGDRSAATLAGLLDECQAYEQQRRQARGAGGLEGFFEAKDPPYEEAAEVALALDRPRLALVLLELGKSRTLLEGLRLDPPAMPTLEEEPPAPAIEDAVGLGLMVTRHGVGVLALDGASQDVSWSELADEGEDGRRLGDVLRGLADTADSERLVDALEPALEHVTTHPTFRRLSESLLAATPPGRTVWLAPHRFLHQAPLQLASAVVGAKAPPAWSIAPALSVVRAFPAPRARLPGHSRVVCGDPLDDLPYARAECLLVAGRDSALAVGSDFDAGWLQARCNDDVGILHLACHGRFERRRPERSGLLLAVSEDEQLPASTPARLFHVEEIAGLRLHGAVVVLSACSSGLEAIRDGDEATGLISALLRAGVSAIIAAQWPIPDLSAMLLMVDLHNRLHEQAAPVDFRSLLAAAADGLRSMSALELSTHGFRLADRILELDGPEDVALTVTAGCLYTAYGAMGDSASMDLVVEVAKQSRPGDGLTGLRALQPTANDQSAVRPFVQSRHWGAFTVVGHGQL
jgi:tetratricopeptide (TPR) repeat protein